MKKRKMLDIFSLAEDKYVNEADPSSPRARKFNLTALLACACCLLLILNIALIIPLAMRDKSDTPLPQSPSQSQNQDLNHIKNPKPDIGSSSNEPSVLLGNDDVIAVLDSLFSKSGSNSDLDDFKEEISDSTESEDKNQDATPPPGSAPSTDLNDNQVQGVSEGDIAKKSDKFLYYISGTELYIYSINRDSSALECMLPLTGYIEDMISYISDIHGDKIDMIDRINGNYALVNKWEMYLSPDYKTLTLIVVPDQYPVTAVVTFDVSRSPSVTIKDYKIFSGNYVSSRVVNGELLLFTKYKVYKGYDKSNPLSYIPFFTTQDTAYLAENVYFPNDVNASTYLMVSRLDSEGLTVKESNAYLSYTGDIYVSSDNIFLTRKIYTGPALIDLSVGKYKTEIAVIGYTTPMLKNKGTVSVNGYIKDQYSMDEYNGILRVATTTAVLKESSESLIAYESSASLFCISLDTMEIVGHVDNFAPLGETVRSARFEKDSAYVCTAVELTDPVFFFDLSDPTSITYTDTGTIKGYSTSLIDLGDGFVIGVGVGNKIDTMKISVYKEEGDTVVEIANLEMENTYYTTTYKAYLVDRDRWMLGMPIRTYVNGTYQNKYLVVYFDGDSIEILLSANISYSARQSVRGFYKSSYFYVVSDNGFFPIYIGDIDRTLPKPSDNDNSTQAPSTGNTETKDEIRDPTKPAW